MTDSQSVEGLEPQHNEDELGLINLESNDPPDYQSLSQGLHLVQPCSIMISGALIFPAEPPADALYQLSRDLVAGNRIEISRIDHEVHTSSNNIPNIRIRDRMLYTLSHRIFDDSSIEIIGKRREAFRSLLMQRTSGLRGERWTLFNTTLPSQDPCRILFHSRCPHKWLHHSAATYQWYDNINRLIAVEEDKSLNSNSSGSSPITHCLRVLKPMPQNVMDVLATAWCARIWNRNLKATGQIRNIPKGKNAYFKES